MNAQIESILRTIDPELYVSEEVFALEKNTCCRFSFFCNARTNIFIMLRNWASGAKDGMLQGTLLGRQTEIDHGFLFGSLGPFIHFSIYSDYAVFFNFIPQSAISTQVEISWIANSGLSTEQVEATAWLWHHTIQQDCRLCEFVQAIL